MRKETEINEIDGKLQVNLIIIFFANVVNKTQIQKKLRHDTKKTSYCC